MSMTSPERRPASSNTCRSHDDSSGVTLASDRTNHSRWQSLFLANEIAGVGSLWKALNLLGLSYKEFINGLLGPGIYARREVVFVKDHDPIGNHSWVQVGEAH